MERKAWKAFFGALANPARMQILDELRTGEKNVTQLIQATGLSQSLVSHNLKRLTDAGLVVSRSHGSFRLYQLNETVVEPLFRQMEDTTVESVREMRARLKMTEDRWRTLMKEAPIYVAVLDEEYKIVYVNYTSPDVRVEDIIGRNIYDLIRTKAARAQTRAAFREVQKTGLFAKYEVPGTKNAAGRWFDVKIAGVKEGNRVTQYIMVTNDVTDLKNAYEGKKKAEEHLHLVLNNAPVIMAHLDAKGVFTMAAGEGLKYLQVKPEDLVGHAISEFRRPDITRLVHRALKGQQFSASIGDTPAGSFKVTFTPHREDKKVTGVTAFAMVQ